MLAAPWSRRQPAPAPAPEPEPDPPLPEGVLGYAVAVWDGSHLAGWTHVSPLTWREAAGERSHWRDRARRDGHTWMSYEVCEVRTL